MQLKPLRLRLKPAAGEGNVLPENPLTSCPLMGTVPLDNAGEILKP
jgi:hypothetical protein